MGTQPCNSKSLRLESLNNQLRYKLKLGCCLLIRINYTEPQKGHGVEKKYMRREKSICQYVCVPLRKFCEGMQKF